MSKKLLFNLNKNVSQDYTYVKYTGTIVTATNTLNKPIKNAILKGDTKYRDIDTGEILDSFDGTKNLELVSVKMPVLQTYDGNIMRLSPPQHTTNGVTIEKINDVEFLFNQGSRQGMGGWKWNIPNGESFTLSFYYEKVSGCENQCQVSVACAGGIADKTDLSEQFGYFEKTYYVRITTPTIVEFKPVGELTSTKSVLKISNLKWYIGNKVYSDKSNILHTPEEIVLKGIGDVKDELNCLTGQVTECIGEYQITGEEEWVFVQGANRLEIQNPKFMPNAISGGFACDKLEPKQGNNLSLYSTMGTYYIGYTSDNYIRIILGNDITFLSQGIEWLKTNKPTIQYTLATPTIKTVDLSIVDQDSNVLEKMNSFNDTTHVITSSDTIPPIFEGYIATKESVE